MEISTMVSTYNGGGGFSIFSYIDALLELELRDYGEAVQSIEIYISLPSPTRNPLPTLDDMFDRWHDSLTKLPLVTFRRQMKRLEIAFVSKHFNASHYEHVYSNTYVKKSVRDQTEKARWKVSPENICLAATEVADALQLVKKRIKREDTFDVDRFLGDATSMLHSKGRTLDEWNAILTRANQIELMRIEGRGPWDFLEIDWSLYHPRAKELLSEPFYWDCSDELAPHGNDTGADTMEEFRVWNRRHRTDPPMTFIKRLLTRCIGPIKLNVEDEDAVQRFLEAQTDEASEVCDEAMIAFPFAVIKMRSTCPPELIRIGLNAIARKKKSMKCSTFGDGIKSEWETALTKMEAKLKSFAN